MIGERIKITTQQGEELQEESFVGTPEAVEVLGREYTYIDTQYNVESHRWADTHLLVYRRDDNKLFGMHWDEGSTETQESGFVYNQPILIEVKPEQKTITTYSAV